MKISIEDVNYIARLSKLRFTEPEAAQMADEFQAILTHFESINKFDLANIDTHRISPDSKSVLRRDEISYFDDKTKLFQNTKSMSGTSIKVPKIIE
jgi:aspartyl-tRNA(Asn)/glutamyl-tRNA(Gln) amidotransferase subunit C